MWRRAVVWLATLVAVGATFEFKFFNPRRQYSPSPQMSCFEYSMPSAKMSKALDKAWRAQKNAAQAATTTVPTLGTLATLPAYPTFPQMMHVQEIARRVDRLLPDGDIVKEHAKLVQDINSLRQVAFVAPLADDNKDYEDSIFQEVIETSAATTARPTTARPTTTRAPTTRAAKPRTVPTFPLILLGGASQRQFMTSAPALVPIPLKLPKPTISLVGTTASPTRTPGHPYPFVMGPKKPLKLCMQALPVPPTMPAAPRRPSLWQRLLSALIPR